MSDRELLELAAKAWFGVDRILDGDFKFLESWNPLTDDGDALRLAVKLHIDLDQYVNSIRCQKSSDFDDADNYEEAWEEFNNDPCAATRRAIVRAAAEIGKEMK